MEGRRHQQPSKAARTATTGHSRTGTALPEGDLHQQPRILAAHPHPNPACKPWAVHLSPCPALLPAAPWVCLRVSSTRGFLQRQKERGQKKKEKHLSAAARRKPSSCPKIAGRGAACCCQRLQPPPGLIFLCLSSKYFCAEVPPRAAEPCEATSSLTHGLLFIQSHSYK